MRNIQYLITGILLFVVLNKGITQVFHKVVSKDGTGGYTTIQSALNSVPNSSATRTLIFVKKGIYNEKVDLAPTKINVNLIGEDADSVIITNDAHVGDGTNTSAATTYTFLAEGADFYAENITFENSAGNVGQAVAIRTTGERQVFKNCRFLGFQDTYYAHKNRQYNLNCYISGATDFIFGDATAVFENCTILCKSGGQYITAPSDTKLTSIVNASTFYHGLLFIGCDVLAGAGVANSSYYLGRPWQPNASSVYVSCHLGDHIKPEGWSIWSGTDNHLSGCYAEYKSRDTSGIVLDVSQRVSWSKQLTLSDVNDYYNLEYFLKKNDVAWDPVPVTENLAAPEGLSIDNKQLNWTAVDSAIGYIVLKNGNIFAITDSIAISDTAMVTGDTYAVKSVSKNGNLSEPSSFLTGIHSHRILTPGIKIYVANDELYISENVDLEIYSITGLLMERIVNTSYVSLERYAPGVYVVKTNTASGNVLVKKILLH